MFLIQVTVSPQPRSWTAIPAVLRVCSRHTVKPALPQRKMSKNYLKKKVASKIRKYADDTKLFRPVRQGQTVKYFKD